MQDRSYSGVGGLKALIQALAGVGSFTTEEDVNILDFVNRRASQAYNMSPSWSRYLVSSEGRDINAYTFSGATASTDTAINDNYVLLGQSNGGTATENTNIYVSVSTKALSGSTRVAAYKQSSSGSWVVANGVDAQVQSDGRYNISSGGTAKFTEADTNKKDQLENVEVWTPSAGSDVLLIEAKNLIPYEQTDKTAIGEFIRIHRKQAFYNNSALEYDFFVDSTGANILNISSSGDNKAFVTYKKRLSLFTENSTDIPGEFFHYLAHASYADFLRMDGQHGKALQEEEVAMGYINSQLEQIDIRNNNNSINHKFSTYVNRQSR